VHDVGVDVRPALPSDAAEIARLGVLMFEALGLEPDDDFRRRAADTVAARVGDGSVVAFVVDDPAGGGRLVANAAAVISARLPHPRNPSGRTAYVQYVCTEAAWRGRGLGRAVMQAVVDWCRDNDVLLVELHASPDGLALYRSMGFDENPNPALRLRLPRSNSA
jgi:GNAT superfamily N-acetyltransferase